MRYDTIRAQEQNNLISISNGMQVLTRNFNWKLHENGWLAMRDVSYSTRSPYQKSSFLRDLSSKGIKEKIDQTSVEMKNLFFPFIIFIILFEKKPYQSSFLSNIIQKIFFDPKYIFVPFFFTSLTRFQFPTILRDRNSREERKINGPSNWI